MLFVLNKEKIYAYVVSVLTVVALFCISKNVKKGPENVVSTSTNVSTNNTVNEQVKQ